MEALSLLMLMVASVPFPVVVVVLRMLLLSEVLHKFTLSYPVGVVTLHDGQILVAKDGTVKAVALVNSGYSPIMFWSGELAAKIVAMNLYNPSQFISATVCGVFKR